MNTCPRGCDALLEYVGIDDGFGDNGDLFCDLWECPACGEQVVGDCSDELSDIFQDYDYDNRNEENNDND